MIGTLVIGTSGTCVFSGSFDADVDRLIEEAEAVATFRAVLGHRDYLAFVVVEAREGDLFAHRTIDMLALEGVAAFALALETILEDA